MVPFTNTVRLSIAVLLAAAAFGCAPQTETALPFADSFQEAPASPWMWIRETPQAHRSNGVGLEIMLEPGSLMGEGKGVKNVLVRPFPANAGEVRVTVDFHPENQYEQAGLILYANDDRYIKLVKEFVDGEPYIVMAVEVDAKITFLNKIPAPKETAVISLKFGAGTVSGSLVNSDGEYQEAGKGEFPMSPRPRIGVFTQNGVPENERWATFTDFQINKTR